MASSYEVSYCRRWNYRKHAPIDPLTADQARQADSAREAYAVALADPADDSALTCVVEVDWANDHAGVWFFDEVGRQAVNYAFRRTDEQLFLWDMIQYDYPDDEPRGLSGANRTEEFTFREDGVVQRVVTDDDVRERTVEDRSGIDVTSHWEPVPAFGEWDSIARWDRDAE